MDSKQAKPLQIAINTLNYPASLKAFMLLSFPVQKRAPDCGCLEWNIQEGVERRGRGREREEGRATLCRPGRVTQLAGGTQWAIVLAEGCICLCALELGTSSVPGGRIPCP